MVSESVLCPVNMMIGALKPFLRNMRTASRPSRSGRPTSMITRSTWPDLAALHPLAAAIDRDRLEFFMQGKLLDHRVAQYGIIVHDQDLADIRHGRHLRKLPIMQCPAAP